MAVGDAGRLQPCLVLFLSAALCGYGTGDQSNITRNYTDCGTPGSDIVPHKGNQSEHFPDYPSGDTVEMYCEVYYTDSSCASAASATYRRFPPRHSSAPSPNISITWSATSNHLRVNLTVRNLTKDDAADYTIVVGEGQYVCANISLTVGDECYGLRLEPMTQRNVSVTAPLGATSVKLAANFTGDANMLNVLPVIFSNETVSDLNSLSQSHKYSWETQKYPNCIFSVTMVIHNLSMADAGLYTARATGLGYSSKEVFFDVEIVNPATEKDFSKLISLLAVVFFLLPVALCATVYVNWRRKRQKSYQELTEAEDGQEILRHPPGSVPSSPLVLIQRDHPCTQITTNRCSSLIILYCRQDISQPDLEDFLELLDMCPRVNLHIDVRVRETHGHYPENWTRWMQQELDSCDHILVICSSQLHQAFTHSNDTQMDFVEMFEGQFHAGSILNCIQPSKTVLLFVNRPKDPIIIPLPQLRDRKSFELNLTDLLEAVQDDHTLLGNAIEHNDNFRDFKDLFKYLQY